MDIYVNVNRGRLESSCATYRGVRYKEYKKTDRGESMEKPFRFTFITIGIIIIIFGGGYLFENFIKDTNYEEEETFTYEETESPYTEAELQSDPTAPSTNPNDYDSNGQYVPENGQSNKAEDYNADGEYKPIESMTQEEKEEELERLLYGE